MKKIFIYILLAFSLISASNVNACGELKSIKVENATIKANSQTEFLVTLKENISEVMLDATTDYEFVEGYEPRIVKTDQPAVLKVNGNACGYGIYTYYIDFKVPTTLIADNTESSSVTYNVKLKNISIENINLDFKPDVFEYSFDVSQDTEYLIINATKEQDTDSVIISSNSLALKNGLNKVTVTVNSKDAEVGIYTFNVTRKDIESDNNYLASLTITGYPNFNFDRSITEYTLAVNSADSLININAISEDKNAKVEVLGNNNLKNGSVVTVKVTAENKEERNYTIKIKKSFNIMDYWIYLVVAGLIIILALLLILSKNGKNKNKSNKVAPETLDTPQETAGEIFTPEVSTPQVNTNEVETQTIIEGNATLEVITPTDIETPVSNEQIQGPTPIETYEQHAQTEVFKL